MGIEWKFAIGDYVANEAYKEELVKSAELTDVKMRLNHLRVEERIAIENVNGTALFYACRTSHGAVEKHREQDLIKGVDMWNAWADAMLAQDKRLKGAM